MKVKNQKMTKKIFRTVGNVEILFPNSLKFTIPKTLSWNVKVKNAVRSLKAFSQQPPTSS